MVSAFSHSVCQVHRRLAARERHHQRTRERDRVREKKSTRQKKVCARLLAFVYHSHGTPTEKQRKKKFFAYVILSVYYEIQPKFKFVRIELFSNEQSNKIYLDTLLAPQARNYDDGLAVFSWPATALI